MSMVILNGTIYPQVTKTRACHKHGHILQSKAIQGPSKKTGRSPPAVGLGRSGDSRFELELEFPVFAVRGLMLVPENASAPPYGRGDWA